MRLAKLNVLPTGRSLRKLATTNNSAGRHRALWVSPSCDSYPSGYHDDHRFVIAMERQRLKQSPFYASKQVALRFAKLNVLPVGRSLRKLAMTNSSAGRHRALWVSPRCGLYPSGYHDDHRFVIAMERQRLKQSPVLFQQAGCLEVCKAERITSREIASQAHAGFIANKAPR